MKIVVTGSLGNISKPLTIELVQKGHSVTVISSKADRQKDIEALGAKAAIGSITDAKFLSSAFQGADIVYLMEPPFHFADPNADIETLWKSVAHCYVQAIQKSGVTKAIHLSSIGGHTDKGVGILAAHHLVENILNGLANNVSIKFMRPVGFYGNLMANVAAIKQLSKGFIGGLLALQHYGIGGFLSGKRGIIMGNYGGDVVNLMVSPIDIAAVIAEEMDKPFEGRTIRYIASEELTFTEIAKILGEAIGKPYLKHGKISDKMLTNAMIKQGMNEKLAKGIVEMGVAGRTGLLYEDYYKHRPVLGKVKLKEFAKEFAAAYNKK
ncbi:uncharacterized protein YbjT (DUF2867 family) [Pedobacter sp. UYP30]|uniref:NAD(P)H-binding protein n=1 Tax=Pedobacter sp. UYP30 TaxID=1756400 RepID=UPI00339626FD